MKLENLAKVTALSKFIEDIKNCKAKLSATKCLRISDERGKGTLFLYKTDTEELFENIQSAILKNIEESINNVTTQLSEL